MVELRQLSIRNVVVSSWSKILLKGTGLSYLLNSFFSDQSYRTLDESLIRTLLFDCLLAEPTSFSKKMKKNNALELVSDQTQLRSKTILMPLIRPKCSRIPLWSHFSDQIDLWSDHPQTIVQTVVRSKFLPDPVISVWEHTVVRSTGSDYKSIWVGTSNWVRFHWSIIWFIVIVWCFRLPLVLNMAK